MKPVHTLFWELLPFALQMAEIRKGFPGKAVATITRLQRIENGSDRPGGQTGYLGNDDNGVTGADLAALRVEQLVAHVYDGQPEPFWLESAEK